MSGLVAGLRRGGVDLAAADLIVGTSAGAMVGAVLASGQDTERLAEPTRPTPGEPELPPVDPDRQNAVFALLRDGSLEPAEARRRIGALAAGMDGSHQEIHLDRMAALVGARDWPPTALKVAAVDIETGERVVFDRESGVALLPAVVASRALPGIFPPVTIDGRRYMDGGMHSATNADLAAGARLIVLVDPMASVLPRDQVVRELAEADADTVVAIAPDEESAAAIGPDLSDRSAWVPAYRAGDRQGEAAAESLLGSWAGGQP
ncbi:patatin-like phospholipase family protein [Rhodococcus spelaei]|uniref:Patatin-like phospholipase family protein n=2 Tax=Rhodococcus spelaei TaxID=2546320 RepID=A0A541B2G3_9NOCA|nr:patatin-like phospholipase family protein [Rhodococcus spelaei]